MTQHDTKTAQPLPKPPKLQTQKNRLNERFDLMHTKSKSRDTERLPVRN